jgi:hypothetical protein
MNPPRRHHLVPALGLLIVAGIFLAVRAATTAPSKAALQSQHIKETIDALFKHRLKPEPLPVTLPNPFVVISGVISAKRADGSESDPAATADGEAHDGTSATRTGDNPPASDAEALARHIASLKIGGALQLNGQLQLIINQAPRKEGDLIFLDNKNAVTYLRLIRLTPTELTLGFNEAVQTIRLKP